MRHNDPDWVASLPELSLRELLSELIWNWQPTGCPPHDIEIDEDGIGIDKLWVGKDGHCQYKTDNWKITAATYVSFESICKQINHELERHDEIVRVKKTEVCDLASFKACKETTRSDWGC